MTRVLQRAFAALCTFLVLALGVVAVDDSLHARLHAAAVSECGHVHDDATSHPLAHDDAACAVELFAAGVTIPLDPTHVVVAPLTARSVDFAPADHAFLAPPAHLLPPGRGPPRV